MLAPAAPCCSYENGVVSRHTVHNGLWYADRHMHCVATFNNLQSTAAPPPSREALPHSTCSRQVVSASNAPDRAGAWLRCRRTEQLAAGHVTGSEAHTLEGPARYRHSFVGGRQFDNRACSYCPDLGKLRANFPAPLWEAIHPSSLCSFLTPLPSALRSNHPIPPPPPDS
jgi:hypothetical protein